MNEHISSAYDRDLEGLIALIMKMGGLVEEAILDAAKSLETRRPQVGRSSSKSRTCLMAKRTKAVFRRMMAQFTWRTRPCTS